MSSVEAASLDDRIEALHRRLAEHSLGGHWQDRERDPKLVPHVWPWEAIYSCLMESGEVIHLGDATDAANRRTVQLVNPAITRLKSTTRTLQMSIQLVRPGETAECHRHTAAALRFVVEGDGSAYTNVEGEVMPMEPGDLILTPHWTWHDHQNKGDRNVVWLDVLDTHLMKRLDAGFSEPYSAQADAADNYFEGASQAQLHGAGYCQQRYGPVRPRVKDMGDRAVPYVYKWRDVRPVLDAMLAAGERDRHDGVLLEYRNPVTGGPTMPTIGCQVQLLAPGETTERHRHTSGTIYHVVEGSGVTTVGEGSKAKDLPWGGHDCFFVPSWEWHRHRNPSRTEPAVVFSVTDRPVLESLGLYREEEG